MKEQDETSSQRISEIKAYLPKYSPQTVYTLGISQCCLFCKYIQFSFDLFINDTFDFPQFFTLNRLTCNKNCFQLKTSWQESKPSKNVIKNYHEKSQILIFQEGQQIPSGRHEFLELPANPKAQYTVIIQTTDIYEQKKSFHPSCCLP